MKKLSQALINRLRSEVDYTRKAVHWSDVEQSVVLSPETFEALPKKVVNSNVTPITEMFTPAEVEKSVIWIVMLINHPTHGGHFLVNTEGYLYARYTAKIRKAF